MFSVFQKRLLIILCCFFIHIYGCTKWVESTHQPSNNQITPSSNREFLLTVTADVKDKRAYIEVQDIPENTEIYCELDYKPYTPCSAKMEIVDLTDGEYLLHITAKNAEGVKAVGEVFFRVGIYASQQQVLSQKNELALAFQTPFKNGEAQLIQKNLNFKFKPIQDVRCNATFECSYGDREPSYWKKCSSSENFEIKESYLAKGLQFVHVRAKCDNIIGPLLTYHFYGVDQRYFQDGKAIPLTLDYIHDRHEKKYIFHLMKANDCVDNDLSYECRHSDEENFIDCDRLHKNPPADFSIRAKCSTQHGPSLKIRDLNGTQIFQ